MKGYLANGSWKLTKDFQLWSKSITIYLWVNVVQKSNASVILTYISMKTAVVLLYLIPFVSIAHLISRSYICSVEYCSHCDVLRNFAFSLTSLLQNLLLTGTDILTHLEVENDISCLP